MSSKSNLQHPKTLSPSEIEKLHLFSELHFMHTGFNNYITKLMSNGDIEEAYGLYCQIIDLVIKHEDNKEVEEVSSVD